MKKRIPGRLASGRLCSLPVTAYVPEEFTPEQGRSGGTSRTPRRAGLRAGQSSRGRRAQFALPIQPQRQEPPAALPRRVRRDLDISVITRSTRRSAPERAEDLYEKVFVEYGDDSVAQLAGVHVACEQSSNVLTKVLEWVG